MVSNYNVLIDNEAHYQILRNEDGKLHIVHMMELIDTEGRRQFRFAG